MLWSVLLVVCTCIPAYFTVLGYSPHKISNNVVWIKVNIIFWQFIDMLLWRNWLKKHKQYSFTLRNFKNILHTRYSCQKTPKPFWESYIWNLWSWSLSQCSIAPFSILLVLRSFNHKKLLETISMRLTNHWLSVRLQTKWWWVRVQLQSLKLQISRQLRARGSLTFRQL